MTNIFSFICPGLDLIWSKPLSKWNGAANCLIAESILLRKNIMWSAYFLFFFRLLWIITLRQSALIMMNVIDCILKSFHWKESWTFISKRYKSSEVKTLFRGITQFFTVRVAKIFGYVSQTDNHKGLSYCFCENVVIIIIIISVILVVCQAFSFFLWIWLNIVQVKQ